MKAYELLHRLTFLTLQEADGKAEFIGDHQAWDLVRQADDVFSSMETFKDACHTYLIQQELFASVWQD